MPHPDAAPDFSPLDPCVHCGLCLSACPTYLATGDESDSPRGRIVLMRALERGEIPASDPGLREHLERCLGCRGCEPACPSGVGYGRGLEVAREILARDAGLPWRTRAVLQVFGRRFFWGPLFGAARLLRESRIARQLAGPGRLGRLMGMVAATGGQADGRAGGRSAPDSFAGSTIPTGTPEDRPAARLPASPPSVVLFRGCVMDVLFRHVHEATRRTLEANGYRVVEVEDQACCGAPHEHAGDRDAARHLARENLRRLLGSADYVVVNSAGCGAMLRDYGHLLGSDEGAGFSSRVRDVTELLAEAGPRTGAPLLLEVAYDAPCHLQHAQRVHAAPLAVLRSIPGLRLRLLPGFDRCCGGAGAYALLQPELSEQVLADKVATLREASPALDAVATGNPGCIMQIGAGLLAAGLKLPVLHPVELLDRSYAEAGLYR
ncbi:MAG TPA: (Fe-S)-binding protein [Gemmatimonadales bacterium]|nr:(Fe-S)-binding protein [Gemmatimonadales bacterium]